MAGGQVVFLEAVILAFSFGSFVCRLSDASRSSGTSRSRSSRLPMDRPLLVLVKTPTWTQELPLLPPQSIGSANQRTIESWRVRLCTRSVRTSRFPVLLQAEWLTNEYWQRFCLLQMVCIVYTCCLLPCAPTFTAVIAFRFSTPIYPDPFADRQAQIQGYSFALIPIGGGVRRVCVCVYVTTECAGDHVSVLCLQIYQFSSGPGFYPIDGALYGNDGMAHN